MFNSIKLTIRHTIISYVKCAMQDMYLICIYIYISIGELKITLQSLTSRKFNVTKQIYKLKYSLLLIISLGLAEFNNFRMD